MLRTNQQFQASFVNRDENTPAVTPFGYLSKRMHTMEAELVVCRSQVRALAVVFIVIAVGQAIFYWWCIR